MHDRKLDIDNCSIIILRFDYKMASNLIQISILNSP